MCRERSPDYGAEATFPQHLAQTLSLQELRLRQQYPPIDPLPAFIPLDTHQISADEEWDSVAGVRLDHLFRKDAADHRWARVESHASLLGVLHGNDLKLERFWGRRDREMQFLRLKALGYYALTGPTFSIAHEALAQLPIANELSLRRHHRILQEISDAGLVPIPNLYTSGSIGTGLLSQWLKVERGVQIVTRDFSMTRSSAAFEPEFRNLLDVLLGAARPLHVLLLGISFAKAEHVFRQLRDIGCSASILSREPILKGLKGQKFVRNDKLSKPSYEIATESKASLFTHNVRGAAEYFDQLRRAT